MGTGEDAPIADDFFLIAHHYQDGKPKLPGRLMGMAVSAAVIADLALAGLVGVRDGALFTLSSSDGADELGRSVLSQLASQHGELPVRDWLAYLGPGLAMAVGTRLADAGVVAPQKKRRSWRFIPVDSTDAFFKAGRLATMLDNGKPFSLAEAVLVCLVKAAGLLDEIPCLDPAATRGLVGALEQSLPRPLGQLTVETAAAIDTAILTGRT